MHIVIERFLEGTNLWSTHRTLEVRLCDSPADPPLAAHIGAVFEALSRLELPPHLRVPTCPGDWREWIASADTVKTSWGQLVARIAVELQQSVGQPPLRAFLADATEREPMIALECLEYEVAAAALTAAALVAGELLATGGCDARSHHGIVRTADEQYSFGSATGPIVEAARARGVPILRLDDVSRVQLGEGVHARRIRKAATDVTGFLAEQTSTDKAYTKQLWSQLGIPVPAGRIVVDADDAVRAAEELGWPVVVKPLDADYGNGVTLNVIDQQGVRDGYDIAREESESVLVERSLSGALYRFLIVDDRVVSAVRRDPPGVIGDGRQTIRELVDAENQSPRRGPDERWPMHRMSLEREELAFLAEHGLSPDSIPSSGQRVDLRRESYIMAGGETREVLDRVHPHTLDVVRDAVRVVGLDIAGVDLIARDITRPLDEHGGGLLELNAQPAICLHLAPFCDNPQPVGEAIVGSLFPSGATGRIPLALVVGDYPDPAELRPLTRALGVHGQTVAVSTPAVTQVLGRQLSPVTARPADRLDAMYRHPRTAAACLATTAASIVTHGLGTDHCRLLVLADSGRTNFGGQHSTADLARLLPQLLAMTGACLINLDDPVWQTLVEPCEPSFVLAASDISHPVLQRHLQGGGRIALRDGADVVLRTRAGELARTRLPTAAAEGNHRWLIVAAALLLDRTRSRRNHVALARPGHHVDGGSANSRTTTSIPTSHVSNKTAKPQSGGYV